MWRCVVAFEYSEQALSQGLELSVYTLPVARDQLPGQITPDTLQTVQARINENIQRLIHP